MIPDAGPLISLRSAGVPDMLLTLNMPIYLVDELFAEVTSNPLH